MLFPQPLDSESINSAIGKLSLFLTFRMANGEGNTRRVHIISSDLHFLNKGDQYWHITCVELMILVLMIQ